MRNKYNHKGLEPDVVNQTHVNKELFVLCISDFSGRKGDRHLLAFFYNPRNCRRAENGSESLIAIHAADINVKWYYTTVLLDCGVCI